MIIAFATPWWDSTRAFCFDAGYEQDVQERMCMPTRSSPASKRPTFPEDFRSQTVSVLTAIREDWEQTAKPENLLKAQASIGLMLIDIVAQLNLGPKDESAILGAQLYRALRMRWHKNR